MRILIALTYYRPHYSGLTIYVERLAKALVRHGHQVTVLTSRFDKRLPREEVQDGVRILRLDVLMRISKGVIMPGMPWMAWKLIREAEIVNVHLPQLDAAPIAVLARLLNRPVLMTYHCDLRLPEGLIHKAANIGSDLANRITAAAASMIVTNTRDYAENSAFLRRYLPKMAFIPPPVELPQPGLEDVEALRRKANLQPGQRLIGMLARLATEKGVETLVRALPLVLERHPKARVLYVGQHQNVLGEETYAARLAPLIASLGEAWQFLGVLPSGEVAAFFDLCEVTVLPSLNSTESFGMVQIESMGCGTPVATSDLPGVRQPVLTTGMGRITPPGDAKALAEALIAILDRPQDFQGEVAEIRKRYAPGQIAAEYEALAAGLLANDRAQTAKINARIAPPK